MSKRARNALIGATSVVALSITVLIQPWEGRENKAYRDIVGSGRSATARPRA
jgi:GH24 family phage-related lysozyme (muramidase)